MLRNLNFNSSNQTVSSAFVSHAFHRRRTRLVNVVAILLTLFTLLHQQFAYGQRFDNVDANTNEVYKNSNSAQSTTTTKLTKINAKEEDNASAQNSSNKPNIVIILIDDLGYNDLSFHGSNQILTPNIDALAYNGIILNRHYVPNLCTPSRATLLTGKYPIHTGTQHYVIINDEPWGLPLTERLMPEFFRDAGYSTNLIGKWHLGFWKQALTPTMRGFDYHYGYYSGYIDYYDYTMRMLNKDYAVGNDLHRNLEPWHKANGTYATEEFTNEAERVIRAHDKQKPLFLVFSHLAVHTGNEDDPMQAPAEEVEKFSHITNSKRRTYAGMVSSLDRSVGRTMRALADKGILNNTIVLLYSDNGAPTVGVHANAGSNFPYRGQKESPWEGGILSAGLIWSPLLQQRNYVSEQILHATDWLPTLASAAGVKLPAELKLDGTDQWATLSQNLPPKSRSLLHVLDDNFFYASYMRDDFKYVNGTTSNGEYDGWLGELARTEEEQDPQAAQYAEKVLSSEVQAIIGQPATLNNEIIEKLRSQATHRCPKPLDTDPNADMYQCKPLLAPCVFNIAEDPCERFNLAKLRPDLVVDLEKEIDALRSTAVPSARVPYSDPRANPAYHNYNWEWWDDLGKNAATPTQTHTNVISGFWIALGAALYMA